MANEHISTLAHSHIFHYVCKYSLPNKFLLIMKHAILAVCSRLFLLSLLILGNLPNLHAQWLDIFLQYPHRFLNSISQFRIHTCFFGKIFPLTNNRTNLIYDLLSFFDIHFFRYLQQIFASNIFSLAIDA